MASYDLTSYNTLGLPSQVADYFLFTDWSQCEQAMTWLKHQEQFFVLGGGSNVVLAQSIHQAALIMRIKGVALERDDDFGWYVRAYAGETWHEFVTYCLSQGWYGLENLALIPGSVGAAPVQNIGAYGVEVKDFIERVEVYDLEAECLRELSADECRFSYRHSIFKDNAYRYVITSVLFKLPKLWQARLDYPDFKSDPDLLNKPTPQAVYERVCAIRKHKLPDPLVIGNAGSFFKNPVVSDAHYHFLKKRFPNLVAYPVEGDWKLAAGWLIDQLGWKGKQLGAAGVHDRQALVLVNRGGAVFDDIAELAHCIQEQVRQQYEVELVPEPVFIK